MEKFKLYICVFNLKISSRIDEWIQLAVEKEVKKFDIDLMADYLTVYNTDRDAMYTLPQTIFSAKLLTTLRLCSCKIVQPSDALMLCSLKSLTLKQHLRVSKALKLKFIMIHQSSDELLSVEIIASKSSKILACLKMGEQDIYWTWLDQDFHHLISQFPFVKHLSVRGCKFLERIMISSDRLKSLAFGSCASLKAIHLDTPNLISFSYHFSPFPIAVTNAPCPHSKVWICPGGMPLSDYRVLLDGLLWSCCPRTLHVNAVEENEHKFLQWLYEELRNRCVNCCNSHNIKCWRHYLKDVKILSTLQMEDWRRENWKLLNRDDDDLRDVWAINQHVTMCFDLDWVQ
ncbi:hypothetical protein Patl1_34242 [Pistacia atlantica]|uniref:Uncharacterized protein n=1 Tax=Pistacia atlantica TaxID=434234 RepID=A0ACC0ZRX4_9ROSI|nr:hypothetical protein Patl1_34242 [Pistacia atlantica]